MPPLGKMPMSVQDASVDVNLRDVLLDVVVHSKVPIFDVVLLPDDVKVVLVAFVVVLLVDDVGKVDGQNNVDVFFPQFLMSKVMSKSACVIFSRLFFSWVLSSLVKLFCILSIMIVMLMLISLAMLMLMHMLLSLMI